MTRELAKQAYNALRYNRRRTVLTMLGMAWGIATVVLLLAYGAGFERGLWSAFRSFGTNLVFIFPGRTELQAGGTKAGTQVRLTVNDLDYIRAEVPLLKRVSPEVAKQCLTAYGTRSATYGVSGVYAAYGHMRRMEIAEGTFFSESDDFTHNRVAVIGSDAKKKLFSGQNALGESVRLDGISYQIIGILKHQVQNGDDNINEHLYVPYSAMSDLTNAYYLSAIVMEYEGDHAKVVNAVRQSMGFHHNFDPKDHRAVFVFDVFADLMDLQVITTGIKILLGFIGLLTLGIGGVGHSADTRNRRGESSRRAPLAHPVPVPGRSPGDNRDGRPAGRGPSLRCVVGGWVPDAVECLRGKRQRGRHPLIHRRRHPALVDRHPEFRRRDQRHAARNQSRAVRSDRSFALRITF